MTEGALQGLRVLDTTTSVAGPFCTKLLADWGADVVKIEPPAGGDPCRREGPFPNDNSEAGTGGIFLYLNSNKKSVTLDLTLAEGRSIFRSLAGSADVVVEDGPPGNQVTTELASHGTTPPNPFLVVTSITLFGQTGPYARWAAREITLCALSGLMGITGERGKTPLKMPGPQMELQAGLHAASATLAAVLARDLTGAGQRVDISIFECAVNMLGETFPMYAQRGVVAKREGNRQPGSHPYTILPCLDGFVAVIAAREDQWTELVRWTGLSELADPRFATGPQRRAHADEIDAILTPWLKSRSKRALTHEAQARRLPFGAVLTPGEVVSDPHLAHKGFFLNVDAGKGQSVRVPGSPVRCSRTAAGPGCAPALGAHTEEVLCGWLGLSEQDLAQLRHGGAI